MHTSTAAVNVAMLPSMMIVMVTELVEVMLSTITVPAVIHSASKRMRMIVFMVIVY